MRRARRPAHVDPISGHFIAQAQRPGELWDVDVFALTPYQRALLTNDGTVTRFVEASVLEPLTVDVIDQRGVEGNNHRTLWLNPPPADSIVRRRVAITGRHSSSLYALAESLLVPSRLPSPFISSLEDNPKGLGEVIGQLQLETRRELLWFGYATAPGWVSPPANGLPFLTRSYRVIIAGAPAIQITESFPTAAPLPTPGDAARRGREWPQSPLGEKR